jgi:hypothetical protein
VPGALPPTPTLTTVPSSEAPPPTSADARSRGHARRSPLPRRAARLGAVLAFVLSGAAAAAPARTAPSGLPYSTAGASIVQPQPAADSCQARGSRLYSLPDHRCTPGAVNPAVTQASIGSTICRSGWSATVRPSPSITSREKRASLLAYGDGARPSGFEFDHLVALELGGAANDARNLWPEPDYRGAKGFYLNPKDRLERVLNRLVCDRRMTLARAQRLIADDWAAAYRRYG